MVDLALAGPAEHGVIEMAHAADQARSTLKAEAIAGAGAYEALKSDWLRLALLQPSPTPFQTPSLLSEWARHFAGKNQLLTIVVRRNGRAVLIWPLIIERGAVRIARVAGSPLSQYDEMLADPECDLREAFAEAMTALRRHGRPSVILLERVRSDSALRFALGDIAPSAEPEGAPYTDLSDCGDALKQCKKTKFTKQIRKREAKFDESGTSKFEVATTPEEAERWLAEAMALKYEWLRTTGRVSRAFMRGDTVACLSELARNHSHPDASPRAVISRLSLDDATAAIEFGIAHNGVYHLYLGAFAPEQAKHGPGNILTGKVFSWCAANGIRRYDMMSPRTRNKLDWQSGEVEVFDFALPVTTAGRLYVDVVLRRIRPALRNAFYALPDSVRSVLAGRAVRSLTRAGR